MGQLLLGGVGLAADGDKKLAVPSEDDQKKSTAVVANLYKSDYERAKNPADKTAFAKKLIGVAETVDAAKDPEIGRASCRERVYSSV